MTNYSQLLLMDESDNDPRYSLPPVVDADAPYDSVIVLIVHDAAAAHGIDLDDSGFPTSSSLEDWHRVNNPHLFE